SLQWLRNTICTEEVTQAERMDVDPYKIMTALAAEVQIGADNLIYLPYLMGERSPHPDPDCRGVFFGLSAIHERKHLIRAVLEGVVYSQLECIDVFREMGVNINDMMICGGGAKSELWRQMFADVYRCPVSTIEADQGGALGAAILAGVGSGVYRDLEKTCKELIRKKATHQPIAENSNQYQKYYTLYKELYAALFDSFKRLAE
ncbi:MAG: FGGY-family carbohydrate kinase, partial [Eubacteriales bacterium]|nr:FGGY-family carbohydrate kinase [Eubacteriales bacterium]